jgi:hypothetical protein
MYRRPRRGAEYDPQIRRGQAGGPTRLVAGGTPAATSGVAAGRSRWPGPRQGRECCAVASGGVPRTQGTAAWSRPGIAPTVRPWPAPGGRANRRRGAGCCESAENSRHLLSQYTGTGPRGLIDENQDPVTYSASQASSPPDSSRRRRRAGREHPPGGHAVLGESGRCSLRSRNRTRWIPRAGAHETDAPTRLGRRGRGPRPEPKGRGVP